MERLSLREYVYPLCDDYIVMSQYIVWSPKIEDSASKLACFCLPFGGVPDPRL